MVNATVDAGMPRTVFSAWDVFAETYHLYFKNFRTFVGLAVLMGFAFPIGTYFIYQSPPLMELIMAGQLSVSSTLLWGMLIMVAGGAWWMFALPALMWACADMLDGRALTLQQSMAYITRERVKELFSILNWVGMIVLLGLVFLVVPGILFGVRYAVCLQAYQFQGTRGLAALQASRDLVKGRGFKVLGVLLLLLLSQILIGLGVRHALSLGISQAAWRETLGSLIDMFLTPLWFVGLTILYRALK